MYILNICYVLVLMLNALIYLFINTYKLMILNAVAVSFSISTLQQLFIKSIN